MQRQAVEVVEAGESRQAAARLGVSVSSLIKRLQFLSKMGNGAPGLAGS